MDQYSEHTRGQQPVPPAADFRSGPTAPGLEDFSPEPAPVSDYLKLIGFLSVGLAIGMLIGIANLPDEHEAQAAAQTTRSATTPSSSPPAAPVHLPAATVQSSPTSPAVSLLAKSSSSRHQDRAPHQATPMRSAPQQPPAHYLAAKPRTTHHKLQPKPRAKPKAKPKAAPGPGPAPAWIRAECHSKFPHDPGKYGACVLITRRLFGA